MQWFHLQFKQETYQRGPWEHAPWVGGRVLTATKNPVPQVKFLESVASPCLLETSLNKRFYIKDAVTPNREKWLDCNLDCSGGHISYLVTPHPFTSADWPRPEHWIKDTKLIYKMAWHKHMKGANWIIFLSGTGELGHDATHKLKL